MALRLDLILIAYGSSHPYYIAEYAIQNEITEEEAKTTIENDVTVLPSYIELHGHKWELSNEYIAYFHMQLLYLVDEKKHPFDKRVIVYDYDKVLCSIKNRDAEEIMYALVEAQRNRDVELYGIANIVEV